MLFLQMYLCIECVIVLNQLNTLQQKHVNFIVQMNVLFGKQKAFLKQNDDMEKYNYAVQSKVNQCRSFLQGKQEMCQFETNIMTIKKRNATKRRSMGNKTKKEIYD